MRALLAVEGMHINAPSRAVHTPLMLAAGRAHEEAVTALLELHADVHTADEAGWTALHHAAAAESGAVCVLLVRAGAIVDARTMGKRTARDLCSGATSSAIESAREETLLAQSSSAPGGPAAA